MNVYLTKSRQKSINEQIQDITANLLEMMSALLE